MIRLQKSCFNQKNTIPVKDCVRSYEILKNRGAEFITPPVINGAETRCPRWRASVTRDPSNSLTPP